MLYFSGSDTSQVFSAAPSEYHMESRSSSGNSRDECKHRIYSTYGQNRLQLVDSELVN